MGNVNTSFNDRVRFILSHDQYGRLETQMIEGWDNDEKEIARNEEYHGIFPKFSNSLKFVGEARDYIRNIYDIYGINSDIRLVKDEKNNKNDQWERSYDGFLDLSTYEYEDGKVGIKFNSGGLEQILKARESDAFEMERETTVDGKPLDAPIIKEVELEGRKINLVTVYEKNPDDNTAFLSVNSSDGNTRHTVVGIPLKLKSKSHEEAADVTPNTNSDAETGEVGIMFFLDSENRRELKITGNLKFQTAVSDPTGTQFINFWICLTRYGQHDDFNARERRYLYFKGGSGYEILLLNHEITTLEINETIQLDYGDHLALEMYLQVDFGESGVEVFSVATAFEESNLVLDEDSFFEKSKSKFMFLHDVAERLCTIMTNQKKTFKSDYFGRTELGYPKNGIGAFIGLSHGHWIRGFDRLPLNTETSPNNYKSMTTSFKDLVSSADTICNVGLGIEKIGFSERIVLEDKAHFYKRNVTIKLPNPVKKVKRTVAIKHFYSSIDIGYEKGGENEETMGLDEYNGKATYTTILTRLKQTYIKISKYIGSAYAKEFTRRKPFFRYPTTDHRNDDEIFIHDMKPDVSGIYKERKWADDFDYPPTGTYDPASATNLRLSPINLLMRHSWVIGSGLMKDLSEFVRYASSTAKSKLTTKLRTDNDYKLDTSATVGNGSAYSEDGIIVNSELKRARYVPEYVEFEHRVDSSIMRQVNGFSIIDGKNIYNVYGLVEFINENRDIEKGYLMSLKPNGEGKWKLLKFNR